MDLHWFQNYDLKFFYLFNFFSLNMYNNIMYGLIEVGIDSTFQDEFSFSSKLNSYKIIFWVN